jgi:hypothetical protein
MKNANAHVAITPDVDPAYRRSGLSGLGTPAAAHPREEQARHVCSAIEIALSIENQAVR